VTAPMSAVIHVVVVGSFFVGIVPLVRDSSYSFLIPILLVIHHSIRPSSGCTLVSVCVVESWRFEPCLSLFPRVGVVSAIILFLVFLIGRLDPGLAVQSKDECVVCGLFVHVMHHLE